MPYTIVIALDSFKGSMGATIACNAFKRGLESAFMKRGVGLQCDIMPMSDGGEGLLESLGYAIENLSPQNVMVTSPYQDKVNASYFLQNETAIMEMAQSTGLLLTPKEKRRTLYATSYGLGEMIKDAYTKGARKIILGVGGSATNDGGAGCLQALGVEFYCGGNKIVEPMNPYMVSQIDSIQQIHRLQDLDIEILCDVGNVLLGENGASAIYGRQKGVRDNDLEVLESNMRHFANIVESNVGKTYRDMAGSGAAGGVVFGLSAYYNAKVTRGIDRVMSLINANDRIRKADCIITGEGRLDRQSGFGKVPMGIAKLAKEHDKFVVAVCGALGDGYECLRDYIDCMFSLVNKPMSLQEAMENAELLLEHLGVEVGGLLAVHRV